jgi:hypothetical protein
MKKEKMRTFRRRLREDLKDSEFKAHYQEERQVLKLAVKIAKLRKKKGLFSGICGLKMAIISETVDKVHMELGLMEMPRPWKSANSADIHRRLEKPRQKRLGFPTFPQARLRVSF